MQQTVERAIANAQPSITVDTRSVAINVWSVGFDARTVNVGVDSCSVNVDARAW
jgi:hypothetical protein